MSLPSSPRLTPGRYRHYKGGEYQVYELATHSESLEKLVVYRCLYGEHDMWVRPLAMFLETVTVEGVEVPRFELVEPSNVEGGLT